MSALTVIFAEQMERSLQPVSLVLQDVAGRLEAAQISDPASFRAFVGSETFQGVLAAKPAGAPQTPLIAVATSSGVLLDASTGWPPMNIDLTDRDYVAYCNGLNHTSPFVGPTAMARANKHVVLPPRPLL